MLNDEGVKTSMVNVSILVMTGWHNKERNAISDMML